MPVENEEVSSEVETKKKSTVKKSEKAPKKEKALVQKTCAVDEVRAEAKFIRISPIKVQRVANVVRGQSVEKALFMLKRLPHKGARILYKVLFSAASNAAHNHDLKGHPLKITTLLINEGPRLKRFQPKARGRIYEILKRTSHITVGLKSAKGE